MDRCYTASEMVKIIKQPIETSVYCSEWCNRDLFSSCFCRCNCRERHYYSTQIITLLHNIFHDKWHQGMQKRRFVGTILNVGQENISNLNFLCSQSPALPNFRKISENYKLFQLHYFSLFQEDFFWQFKKKKGRIWDN